MQLSTLLILALLYLSLADSYFVSIDANSEECFFERVNTGTKMGLTFEVAEGGFLDIDVNVEGPDGKKVYSGERESNGKYVFNAHTDGVYKYCFGNKMSSMTPKMVMFAMDLGEKPKTEDGGDAESDEAHKKLSSSVKLLTDALLGVKHEQEFMEVRERVHRSINENTNSRVVLWAFFEALVLIAMVLGQIYYLKRFFEKDTLPSQLQQEMAGNILKQYRYNHGDEEGWRRLSALQFMQVWNYFDNDGNGYIENQELDAFITQLLNSMKKGVAEMQQRREKPQHLVPDRGVLNLGDIELKDMREKFMVAFDEDGDNRIDIREMAQILPTDENFLVLFQLDHPLESSVDFMRIWKMFDIDCSGFIEANELKTFIRELLKVSDKTSTVSEDDLIVYTDTMLNLFDRNGDGKLQLSEMARLIPVKENFLLRPTFKKASQITDEDVDQVFDLYDKDCNGTIENNELHGFVKDLLELAYEEYDTVDLNNLKSTLMCIIDVDKDGTISKKELKLIITVLDKMV